MPGEDGRNFFILQGTKLRLIIHCFVIYRPLRVTLRLNLIRRVPNLRRRILGSQTSLPQHLHIKENRQYGSFCGKVLVRWH